MHSVSSTASLDITAVNDAPVVGSVGHVGTISEDGAPVTGDADTDVSVTDPDGGPVTWQLVNVSVDGILQGAAAAASLGITWNADGSYAFNPNAFNGLGTGDSKLIEVSYKANDGEADSNTGTVSFTVTGVNDAPVVGSVGHVGTISEDGAPVTGDADTDVSVTDPDGGPVTWQLVNVSVDGILQGAAAAASLGITWNADGSYAFNPNAFNGLGTGDSKLIEVSYKANDGEANSNTGTVSFTVTGVNDAPVVGSVGHVGTISEDGAPVTGDADTDVSVTDPDGGPVTWQLVNVSVDGILQGAAAAASLGITWNADGSYAFNPNAFNGLGTGDSKLIEVSYKANDGEADSNTGTVSFTVTGVNDAPVVGSVGHVGTISEDGAPVTGDADTDVSVTDPDGGPVTWQLVNVSVDGILQGAAAAASLGITWNADGSYAFNPNAFNGLGTGDSKLIEVSYKANDGEADSNTGTVSFTVTGVNDAPVVGSVGHVGTISEDGAPVTGDADTDVSVTDPDGGPVTWQLVNVSVDGILQGAAAAASLGITWNADGSYAFNPNAFNGLGTGDSKLIEVSYKANDGEADSNTGTVSFTVTGVNDAPVVGSVGHVGTISEDGAPVTGDADTDVSVTDPDGGPVTWQLVNVSVDGILQGAAAAASLGITWNADGSYAFNPNAFNGLGTGDSKLIEVSYKANDGEADSNTGTVSFTVTGVNDAPVVGSVGHVGTISEDGAPVTGDADTDVSVTDPDGGPVTWQLVNVSVDGILQGAAAAASLGITWNADGSYAFNPNAFNGLGTGDSKLIEVSYKANDGEADSNTGTVSFTVTGVNDAPVVGSVGHVGTISEDGAPVTGDADTDVSVTDPDGGPVTWQLVNVSVDGILQGAAAAASLGITWNADGSYAFNPNAFNGLGTGDSKLIEVSYKANDGEADSNTGTVSFTVTGVNDAPRRRQDDRGQDHHAAGQRAP